MSKQKIQIPVSVQCEGVSHDKMCQHSFSIPDDADLKFLQSSVIAYLKSGNWLENSDFFNGRDAKIQALTLENLQEFKIQAYLSGHTNRTQNLFGIPSVLDSSDEPEVDDRNRDIQRYIDYKRKAEQAGNSYEISLSVYIPKETLDFEAGDPDPKLVSEACGHNEPEVPQGPGPVSVTLVTVGSAATVGLLLGLGAWAMKDGAATLGAGLHSLFTSSVASTVGGASSLAVLSGVILTLVVVAGVMMLAKHGPKKQASVAEYSVTQQNSDSSRSSQSSSADPSEEIQ